MYYPFFLTYVLTGLLISAGVFYWALKNRQFTDQQRARYLPLEDDGPVEIPPSSRGRFAIYGIFLLVLAGIGISFLAVLYALILQ